jgi:hypothetical protein
MTSLCAVDIGCSDGGGGVRPPRAAEAEDGGGGIRRLQGEVREGLHRHQGGVLQVPRLPGQLSQMS